jgi:hypothetical protein
MPKRTIKFYAKTADCFCASVYEDGKQVGQEYDGYPPSFLGHDGVSLEIDLDTGECLNWKKPSASELSRLTGD